MWSETLLDQVSVFDSSVWFSAIHFRGTPLAALDLAFRKGHIVCSSYIRAETERKLSEKHQWDVLAVRQFMNFYVRGARDIQVPGHLKGVCRDPKDELVLELAVVANAQFLVTGDNDLLSMHPHAGVSILRPRAYLDLFIDSVSR
jgi:putative PIN family toxin of toxin-antitoxin system